MADNPPPSLSDLGIEPATTDTGSLAELQRNIWPWDDLNAKSQVARWLDLGREVIPTLASLVASGGARPRLLQADAQGRLATAASPYVIDRFADSANTASSTITPANPSLYAPGMFLMLISNAGGFTFGGAQVVQVQDVGPTTIDVAPNPLSSYVPGDWIVTIPPPANFGAPPPGLAPNNGPIRAVRSAAGTTVMVNGQIRQVIRVFGVELAVAVVAAGGVGELQDTAGNGIAQIRTDTIHEITLNCGGVPLAPGVGLQFNTAGAATAVAYAHISTQQV